MRKAHSIWSGEKLKTLLQLHKWKWEGIISRRFGEMRWEWADCVPWNSIFCDYYVEFLCYVTVRIFLINRNSVYYIKKKRCYSFGFRHIISQNIKHLVLKAVVCWSKANKWFALKRGTFVILFFSMVSFYLYQVAPLIFKCPLAVTVEHIFKLHTYGILYWLNCFAALFHARHSKRIMIWLAMMLIYPFMKRKELFQLLQLSSTFNLPVYLITRNVNRGNYLQQRGQYTHRVMWVAL